MRAVAVGLMVAVSLLLGGCDEGESSGPIRNDSPRELLVSLHRACEAENFEALARTKPPAIQPQAIRMLKANRRVVEHARAVAQRVEAEAGKAAGDLLRRLAREMTPVSPLSDVIGSDGRVEWHKVEIAIDGSAATVTFKVDDSPNPLQFAQISGKWYVTGPDESPEQMDRLAEMNERQATAIIEALDRLADDVAAGRVTSETFEKHFLDATRRARGG